MEKKVTGEYDNWEFYKDKSGEHRWRRIATNGKIVAAATEGYSSKNHCQANAERHGYNENPKELGRNDTWEFYKDKSGEHRWRRIATNKEIVGASSESYVSKGDCLENAKRNGYNG